ncbi:hypothetical protein [Phytohabitans rumicis]|uniref:Uncharacterized protein n=1 Tax=Phytohabitans rumicis TaxID=1076125 RepID=A0A6V8LLQ3_9ACTN|nr:hypothetical protein [Phytohabitans rumicis]GFJ95017.1 hypothetical protein Prum_086590 [Phytohabitans rumicis]
MEQRISLVTPGVADPDGHVWEVAYNPGLPLGPDGAISIPDLGAQ